MWTLLVLCATLVPLAASALDCPTGFEDIGVDNNRCYMYISEKKTWTLAYTSCLTSADGTGNLLTLLDPNDFYAQYFQVRNRGFSVWTGLLNIGGIRSWADGTEFNKSLEAFFASDAGDGLYGYMSGADGLIRLDDSATERGYVCFVDLTPPPPEPTPAPPPCEDGWLQYEDTCYRFSGDQQYWGATGHACHELGAEMISIHDTGLLTFLLVQADDSTYWTGLENQGDKYAWEDGSNTTDVADILQPYMDDWSKGNDCVALDTDDFPAPFTHQNCMTKQKYICYKPASVEAFIESEDLDFVLWT